MRLLVDWVSIFQTGNIYDILKVVELEIAEVVEVASVIVYAVEQLKVLSL